MGEVNVYSEGLMMLSACAPKEMKLEDVEAEVNTLHPTGISSPWVKSDDEHFKTGQTNPCVCEQDPSRKHWLMEC